MRYNGFWILASSLLLAASAVPAHANLITDPGFESCTANGDAIPDWTAASGTISCGGNAHTGTFDADESGTATSLSQTITTITGDTYDFSFWVEGESGSHHIFNAYFGSDNVFNTFNLLPYTLEDFTVTASATSTTIVFADETAGGFWALDDVSVTDQGPATPEPASLVLLASGLLAIAWRRTRGFSRVSSNVR